MWTNIIMSITTLKSINITNQMNQIYLKLFNQTINNYDAINIIILENIWNKPIISEKIIKTIEQIKSGSIVIYLFGITINELIPISNFESKADIIQYLKLTVPDILPSQLSKLNVEHTIKIINGYKHLDQFKEKNIILI